MKVYMKPRGKDFGEENGVRRVCENYEKYLSTMGVEFVDQEDKADLLVDHAGALRGQAHVAHNHGLYWTADMPYPAWELQANRSVIEALRGAREVTVPSSWVATNLARDMRITPHVIGHGIDLREWPDNCTNNGFVLWNKNRTSDACDPQYIYDLAMASPNTGFVTTFLPNGVNVPHNVTVTGILPHSEMKKLVSDCAVYLSSTKETFSIGTLEAMACGKPILTFDHGNVPDLAPHGIAGYCAVPGNTEDLLTGLGYCLKHYDTLSDNARLLAGGYTWEAVCRKVLDVWELAHRNEHPWVSIVIPVFNYQDKVGRAIESAIAQTYASEVIVVDDGSTDNSFNVAKEYESKSTNVKVYYKSNDGVANARNFGIQQTKSKYICCLDADDALDPNFIATLVPALESDNSLGIAYTGLQYILPDGRTGVSPWPTEFDPDQQLRGNNQIPTACLFRRTMWDRLGGYQPRCCPHGAGFEDADFWMRATEYGWNAKKVTSEPLFIYSWMSGRVSSSNVSAHNAEELDYYKTWYPWFASGQHLFASLATPKKYSHPVRQYDEPEVSVVIPVGPKHIDLLPTALDSLEAQTYLKWEAIVVFDGYEEWDERSDPILVAYPYVKYIYTGKEPKGAGYARNRGAEQAKANLLLFLDADDWLYPTFLSRVLMAFTETGHGVYTDYTGIAYVDDPSKLAIPLQERMVNYENGRAVIEYHTLDYDCARAQSQPSDPLYLWCNITTLIPTSWHREIGGFDETMESWEDWLYWLKLAWAGKCFTRINQSLMVYRFYTGTRRDLAHAGQNWTTLLEYIRKEKEKVGVMGCSGCGKKNTVNNRVSPSMPIHTQSIMGGIDQMQDQNFRMCVYRPMNKGDHLVNSVVPQYLPQGNYGYHADGDRFLVHFMDVQSRPGEFVVEEIKLPAKAPNPVSAPITMSNIIEYDNEDPLVKLARVREEASRKAAELFPGVAKTVSASTDVIPKKRKTRRVVTQ